MKEWPLPAEHSERRGCGGIVLVGLGSGAEVGPCSLPPLADATRRLADVLALPVLKLETSTSPDAALRLIGEKAQACGGGWLAGLEIDVGVTLADGRCWAEALGAWRQPALLVVPAAQLAGGMPAAATALLLRWQVPLLGLLQWGGHWQAETRRRDTLPWLGLLPESDATHPSRDSDEVVTLATALALRWQQLDQR